MSQKNSGFSLVELAVVVLIGGLLLAAFGDVILNSQNQAKLKTTQIRLEAVDEAIRNYAYINGRLPCAASLAQPVETATYGIEVSTACNTANAGTFRAGGVRIGFVPTRAINLPDSYGYDAWGGRFTYAVTEALTQTATFNINNGAIGLIDSAGASLVTPANSLGYLVISHGQDQEGAYNNQGVQKNPCSTGQNDSENCNNDATFRSTILVGAADTAANFDDYVSYRGNTQTGDIPAGAVMAFNLAACPGGWQPYTAANGRVIIGSGQLGATGTKPTTGTASYTNPNFANGTSGGFPYVYDALNIVAPNNLIHETLPPYVSLLYCEKL